MNPLLESHRFRCKPLLAVAAITMLLSACGSPPLMSSGKPLACDDGIKSAFKPDAQTSVVEVRSIAKGAALTAVDSAQPVTAATDMCLVKLLVGPGVTAEKVRGARSYSEGIGIEVWLPAHAVWNERIRNYGGGGWVGGGHRFAGQIGSKVPAIVNANMGYASGTTDGGQPHYQDASFAFLSSGALNLEGFRDMSHRAMYEQAVKTRALVDAYYGRKPRHAYYDGHSQGGRQGLKVAQEWPELYDGYLIAQPAVSVPSFSLAGLYPQVVMKSELGITAIDKPAAAAFARKVAAANARAVASCDKEKLGFLLDPFSCAYDPLRDAGALCAGAAGQGVTGSSTDAANCLSAKEAVALNKIWYGPTTDGSYDPAQGADSRSARTLASKQLWWGLTRGSNLGGQITGASTDMLALAMGDVSYAADASATSAIPISNASTPVRNRWRELTYATYAQVFAQRLTQPFLIEYQTARTDLSRLRSQGRKMILWNGLAEDVIPPGGAVHYYERVKDGVGGEAQVQQFLRMYNIPGMAHSSQGRAWTVNGANNTVPMPALPGNANQTPTREQDPLFSALVDWVERGTAPGTLVIASRDGSVRYPICVYPQKAVWNGTGSAKEPVNYACR
ncbi:tannase/feruloyl esterase family alpha/beta hydrolase [Caenimonas sedimenti]|uniref:Tannase/feruloyl esterase family alpha/beta hydrolase n=1 Tax=Caenimonas sedimenti TaxID=2596921 RepID=A0A562ZTX4_9BURK|nr:tannase/feruloyl esterase family alpha/beta hydrolase [Caenimonas sedimenti]TWO71788.1 tannase/feruloyl esterase family alpha/beta hydrolase [Caenimonas sedimenti]